MKKSEFAQKIKTNTAEKLTVRFFTALFLSCVIFLISAFPVPFDDPLFFKRVRFLPFVLCLIGLHFVLSLIFTFVNSLKLERLVLLISFTAYALITAFETEAIWYGFGMSLILLVICVYAFKDENAPAPGRDMNKPLLISAAAFAALYFILFTGAVMIFRYLTFASPNYDFGIFSQMFHYMKNTLLPLATAERDMLLSHFAVHISPIFYLFLPVYAVFPSPAALLVCQALLLASGIIPVVMISKRLGLSNKAAAAFALIYALYPALSGGCFYDLHENKFLAPLLLWLFYFIVKNKWYGIAAFSVLVMLVKEDAPVYIAFAGIFVLITEKKKDRLKGLFMLAGAAAYFAFAVLMLNKYGQGTMDERFFNYMTSEKDSLLNAAENIIKDPAYVIHQIFDTTADPAAENKIEFMLRMFIPLGFLPFFTKKLSRYVLLLPLVLVNLMSGYVYQHSIFFQYTYGPLAFLIFLSILNYSELSEKIRRMTGTYAVAASLLICTQSVWQKPNYLQYYINDRQYYTEVMRALKDIPDDASVGADTFFCPALSDHDVLYELDQTVHAGELDYIVLDLRTQSGKNKLPAYERSGDHSEYYRLDGWIAIYKRR